MAKTKNVETPRKTAADYPDTPEVLPVGWVDIPLKWLIKADWNYKGEDEKTSESLRANLKRNGQIENLLIRRLNTGYYEIVNGNHRYDDMGAIGLDMAHVYNFGDIPLAAAQRIAIETNETRFKSEPDKLTNLLQELTETFGVDDLAQTLPPLAEFEAIIAAADANLQEYSPEQDNTKTTGGGENGNQNGEPLAYGDDKRAGNLFKKFGVPPFSILDGAAGYWQERKAFWLALGIKSEKGRGDDLTFSASAQTVTVYNKRAEIEKELGRRLEWAELVAELEKRGVKMMPQTSIFDPVLCELCYRWFCLPGGTILDPFAGGSVRGVVAAYLGFNYTGVELRGEQVEANRENLTEIMANNAETKWGGVVWEQGDSANIEKNAALAGDYDFVFSCPPYGDLEVYSDDAADISNMQWAQFSAAYKAIIKQAVAKLKNNRFAAFVIGEIRNTEPKSGGVYRNFVGLTIEVFEAAGAAYYNEFIYRTAVGSLAIRVGRQFNNSRKTGKTHQNLLVFYKGEPGKISEIFGDVVPNEEQEEESKEAGDIGAGLIMPKNVVEL